MFKKKKINNVPWAKYYPDGQVHLEYSEGSLYDEVEKIAYLYPKYYAYNYFGKKATYQQFLLQIETIAKAFCQLGVEKGDIVTICMPNTPEAIISFYALNKIGAIANVIHPLSAENEIKYYLNVSNSKYLLAIDLAYNKIKNIINETKVQKAIIVSVSESMPTILNIGYNITQGYKNRINSKENVINWKNFKALANKYFGNTKANAKKDDCAAILYSGGTTGKPKGIILTNLNFNAVAKQCTVACGFLKPQDTLLAILPIFHGFGLGICIHTVLTNGATSILIPQFNARKFDELLNKYHPNIIIGVPTLYEALLKNKSMNRVDLSYLKGAISGGDSLSTTLKKEVDKFFKEHNANIQIREGYGLTECASASCLTPINMYKEGSIGVPLPDMNYKIVVPNTDKELPTGEIGEIIISGPSVMAGYLNEEVETNLTLQKHKDGNIWLHTGDLGYMDSDGFVFFKQRLKRMIVSSGYNVYPSQIEEIINRHKDVLTSTVIGIPHPYKVQVAKAYIVLKPNVKTSKNKIKEDIMELCQKNLARYSLPYEIEFRESLPKTKIGKVNYKELEQENINL